MRFALIGLGNHGKRWAGVLDDCGIYFTVVDPRWGLPDIKPVLSKDTDAVLIVTPHNLHASITKQALNAGKHVFCEKPGGIKSSEIKKNITLAQQKGLVYKIGYNYRFHEGFIKARELYNKGKIGNLIFIRAVHGFGGRKGYEKEWRLDKEISGGGHLHDQGVHLIDMVRSFISPISKVRGMRADNYWGAGTEDNGFVLLQGKNNAIAFIHSSLTQWKRKHTFEIYGTKGYLVVEGLGMRYGEPEKLILGKRTKDPDVVKEKLIKCNPIADNSLKKELKEFVSAIKKGEQLDNTDAYETLRIVEQVYRQNKL